MENKSGDNVKAYKKDAELVSGYYLKYLSTKSEQQKLLEEIISENPPARSEAIADIACGAGTLTWHISKLFPASFFHLLDINEDALKLAETALKDIPNKKIIKKSIYDLDDLKEKFDLVFCWQTISWIDKPAEAMQQLIASCKPGGRLYMSFLFNFDHDVDIVSFITDHTRPSGKEGIVMQNNTYSMPTLEKWLKGKVASFKMHEFIPGIDFIHSDRGIGTYTVKTETGKRLQLSAGMMMNWGILEIIK